MRLESCLFVSTLMTENAPATRVVIRNRSAAAEPKDCLRFPLLLSTIEMAINGISRNAAWVANERKTARRTGRDDRALRTRCHQCVVSLPTGHFCGGTFLISTPIPVACYAIYL